ncbi:hypothetical protein CMUST_09010 [Corynebacterium mustelae]|uniref:Integral membrane protein n=1 Tax=Corynebacterium mustelae TaxID=571915 RepID=A0A0G3GYC1_9CORY|nr:hypothetical protein [Corynebacterium mustelae]AKK06119.1 hypothetical protein CMUST_09010 [Corynebacterium mustelae]
MTNNQNNNGWPDPQDQPQNNSPAEPPQNQPYEGNSGNYPSGNNPQQPASPDNNTPYGTGTPTGPNMTSYPQDSYGQYPAQGGYPQGGQGQPGQPQGAYGQSGYPQSGYGQESYGQANQQNPAAMQPGQTPIQGGYPQGNYGQPAYQQPQPQGGYGQSPYGSSGYPAGGYNQHNAYGQPTTVGTGVVGFNPLFNVNMVTREKGIAIMSAITYGFKAVFQNPVLWIVGALVYFVVAITLGMLLGVGQALFAFQDTGLDPENLSTYSEPSLVGIIINFLSYIPLILLMPVIQTAALLQLDGSAVTWDAIKSRMNYSQAFFASILVAVITGIPLVIQQFLASDMTFVDAYGNLQFDSGKFVISLFLGLVVWLLSFFLIFATYFAVESRATATEAITQSVKAVLNNFFPILGCMILMGLIAIFGTIFTLFIGIIVFGPASLNATTHVYRQATKAPYPEI